jgi:hypothetical protein
MASDNRLLWLIFAALVALIAVPLAWWRITEARRPVLEEVRIVTATGTDPVFRTGHRRVSPGDEVQIAAALRLSRAGGPDQWLAPVAELEIDGEPVAHLNHDSWPEDDREVRVFWFTVESNFLGGDLKPDDAARFLELRSYLAPEMGRGLLAAAVPEQHNDDQIDLGASEAVSGGTIRLYARVEVAKRADAVAPEQVVASDGPDLASDLGFATLYLAAAFPEPVLPVAGELFRLPGFEPRPAVDGDWNDVTVDALGATFRDLVERRRVVSSRTFAAVAMTGDAELDLAALSRHGTIAVNIDPPERAGQPLRWGTDVTTGDLLDDRGQWIVLLSDDGNGQLDRSDRVATCWRRPPVVTTLGEALRADAVTAELERHGG